MDNDADLKLAATIAEMKEIRNKMVTEGPDALDKFDGLLFLSDKAGSDDEHSLTELWRSVHEVIGDRDRRDVGAALQLIQAAGRAEVLTVRMVVDDSFRPAFSAVFGDVVEQARETVLGALKKK